MSIEAVDTRARGLRSRAQHQSPGALGILARLDWVLGLATVAAVVYGVWVIDGVTRFEPGGSAASRQALYAGFGLVLFMFGVLIDTQVFARYARFIFLALCGVMSAVLVLGATTRGSRRWIDIGPFTFQPSEFGKPLLAICLAAFLASNARQLGLASVPLRTIGVALVPVFLVFVQPDVGTALVYTSVLAAALFVAGTRWVHLGVLASVTGIVVGSVLWALPAVGVNVLKPYQLARLTSFLHPSADLSDSASYNLQESRIAVGSGGLRGRGIEGATQTALDYLPAHATDFAFASLAEQRGFFGAAALLMLYLLIVWRGLRITIGARDLFGAVLAGAIVFSFLFEVFVNVGMTIGIAPITGIPLPFVSVGGSSMISCLFAMGLLQGVAARGGRNARWG